MLKKPTKQRIVRTRNATTWTEAEFFSRIRSALRKAFMYWIPMQNVLKKAGLKLKGDRSIKYQCSNCSFFHNRKDVEINHKIPCGSLSKYEDIIPFIEKLTTEDEDHFEILCNSCHLLTTKQQNDARKANKSENI
jgi:5-methylcytosine-specific restriction endonuclease McrA